MKFQKFIIILLILSITSSCIILNDTITVEKKFDKTYELHLNPYLVFLNNGKYTFYTEYIYKYPENSFYIFIYPENAKIQFDYDNVTSFFDKEIIELQVLTLKQKKNIFPNLDKKAIKPINKIIKIDFDYLKTIINSDSTLKIVINSVINNEETEVKFFIEIYDKALLKIFYKEIDKFKEKINNPKGKK
jgi:hypothetical protein